MCPSRFSLRDLLTLIAIVIVAACLFLPALLQHLGPVSGRVVCASNLRQIGQAILLYSHENRGRVPRVRFDPAAPPVAFTGADSADPFGPAGPQPNDVTAGLYLLVRTQGLDLTVFNCDKAWQTPMLLKGRPVTGWSNFTSADHLSYSITNPYFEIPTAGTTESEAIRSPEFVVAADINPGTPQLLKATPAMSPHELRLVNSPNHEGDGQNALFGDGHCEFVSTPFAGVQRDNIYTYGLSGDRDRAAGGTGIVGMPVNVDDSVLLPVVAGPRPVPARDLKVIGPTAMTLGIVLCLLVCTRAWVLHRRRREDCARLGE